MKVVAPNAVLIATVGIVVVIVGAATVISVTNLGSGKNSSLTTSDSSLSCTSIGNGTEECSTVSPYEQNSTVSSSSSKTSYSYTPATCNSSIGLLPSNPPLRYTFHIEPNLSGFAFGPTDYIASFVDIATGAIYERNISGSNLGNISVGSSPETIIYVSKTNSFYVGTANSIIAINASTNRVYQNINTSYPYALAYIPTLSELYVGLASNSTLVYNTTDWQLIKTFSNTILPFSIVYDPSNQLVYVESFPSTLVINPSTNQIVTSIPYVSGNILYDPHVNKLYVASANGSIFVVDPQTNKELTMFYGLNGNLAMTYDSQNDYIYVVSGYTIVAFSDEMNQITAGNSTGGSPNYLDRIEYNPTLNLLFASSPESGNVYVFTPFTNSNWTYIRASGCPTTLTTTTEMSGNHTYTPSTP